MTVACPGSLLSVFSCATDAEEPEQTATSPITLGYDVNSVRLTVESSEITISF